MSKSYDSDYSNNTSNAELMVNTKKRVEILMKTILVVLTMVGGAILALCINVFIWKHSLSEMPKEEIPEDDDKIIPVVTGMIKNKKTSECLDTLGKEEDFETVDTVTLLLMKCTKETDGSQLFTFAKNGQIIQGKYCLSAKRDRSIANMQPCDKKKKEQFWKYQDNHLKFYDGTLCLTSFSNFARDPIRIESCTEDDHQIWECIPPGA